MKVVPSQVEFDQDQEVEGVEGSALAEEVVRVEVVDHAETSRRRSRVVDELGVGKRYVHGLRLLVAFPVRAPSFAAVAFGGPFGGPRVWCRAFVT